MMFYTNLLMSGISLIITFSAKLNYDVPVVN